MKNSVSTRILSMFDIPEDSLGTVPRMTVTGSGSILIENHRGLVKYEAEHTVVSGGKLLLSLHGSGLELEAMNRDEIRLRGRIISIDFE